MPDRAEVEARSSRARDPKIYAQLLDETVHRLASKGAEPRDALGVAGAVVRESTWSGFRTGRTRVASSAAAYLTWMAPPSPWTYVALEPVEGRRPLGWESSDGELLFDVLFADRISVRELASKLLSATKGATAVRAIDVGAPMRSVVYESPGVPMPLTESSWWFGGEAR